MVPRRNGKQIITDHLLDVHKNEIKEISSGFFNVPDAENVSDVLFSNTGPIPKFLRTEQQDYYYDPELKLQCIGTCNRHDPNASLPAPFMCEVGDSEAIETERVRNSV